uniref:Ig-like domain-containing protein n=1 Tax=Pygocentrus nattereri TaxID=42514 RepID=A0AAR2LJE4_PYGNA
MRLSAACTLEKKKLSITAPIGGSVLLPCYCTDLHTTPERFMWQKYNRTRWEVISSESGQYRDRFHLVNGHSPGNLSLLISHLTEEDGGVYWCGVKYSYRTIRLTVKGCTLVNNEQILNITAHKRGSVLLPCYCTDLHTKPETFSWKKDKPHRKTWEEISNRFQLVNGHSPGNLSLLISHLTEEDGGSYWCGVKDSYRIILLTNQLSPTCISPPHHCSSTIVCKFVQHTFYSCSVSASNSSFSTDGPPNAIASTAVVSVQTSPTTSTTHSSQKPEGQHSSLTAAQLTILELHFIFKAFLRSQEKHCKG